VRRTLRLEAEEQKIQFIKEHLAYEIYMLRASYAAFHIPGLDGFFLDSMIEVFCVHARNLLEFFRDDVKGADPRTFASGYRPLSEDDETTNRIYERICAQITHLSARRTHGEPKIDTFERRKAYELIEDEIGGFFENLDRDWAARCEFSPKVSSA